VTDATVITPDPVRPALRRRRGSGTGDRITRWGLTALAALILVLIAFFFARLYVEAHPAFSRFGYLGFTFTNEWNVSGAVYGALPLVVGTLITSAVALVIGVPIAVATAVFLTELCPRRLRAHERPEPPWPERRVDGAKAHDPPAGQQAVDPLPGRFGLVRRDHRLGRDEAQAHLARKGRELAPEQLALDAGTGRRGPHARARVAPHNELGVARRIPEPHVEIIGELRDADRPERVVERDVALRAEPQPAQDAHGEARRGGPRERLLDERLGTQLAPRRRCAAGRSRDERHRPPDPCCRRGLDPLPGGVLGDPADRDAGDGRSRGELAADEEPQRADSDGCERDESEHDKTHERSSWWLKPTRPAA